LTLSGVSTVGSCDAILRSALQAKGLRYVGTRGPVGAPVCIVGEAPGKDEDRLGFPFVGYSGQLLDQMLSEVGFNATDTWFTNPYKTRPPENDIKRIGEIGIGLNLFIDQFFEELRNSRPTIIVACGKTPTNLLCPETKPKHKGKNNEDKEGFGSWRGSLLKSPLLDWDHYVIPIYHPAFVLRQYSEREICVFILQRAYEEFDFWKKNGKLNPLPKLSITTQPSFGVAYDFLRRCIHSPDPVAVDIELLRRKVPYTIALAINPTEAMSISFWNYKPNECVILWRLLDTILSSKTMIMQNGTSFDSHWLRALGFSVNLEKIEDTLIRHHVLWPGLRHKLEFQGMQYTRLPYWKEEGKVWSLREGLDSLMRYNCMDTLGDYQIFIEQEKEFEERKITSGSRI
jgi:uracil-DNA glycosylase family 4